METLDDEWRWREMGTARSAETCAQDLRHAGFDSTSRGKRVYARRQQIEVERLPVLHAAEVAAMARIVAESPRDPAPALVDAVRRYRSRAPDRSTDDEGGE